MSKTRFVLLSFAFLSTLQPSAWAQANQHWRFWTPADGLRERYSTFVTVSSNGNVWLNHGDVDQITWLDGYRVYRIQSPGFYRQSRSRFDPWQGNAIFEAPSGRIWTNSSEGLKIFVDEEWISHEIGEVESMGFLPTAKDQVLVLRPDRILEYYATTRVAKIVRYATETNLGQFNHIIPARNGDAWITGTRGLAEVHIDADTPTSGSKWVEYLFDKDSNIRDLHYPFEGKKGQVTGIASAVEDEHAILVHWNGDSWQKLLPHNDNADFLAGWLDDHNRIWVIQDDTQDDTVYLIENGREKAVEKQHVLCGDLKSVYVQPNGVFWLTSSQGIARYAPPAWRTPSFSAGAEVAELYEDSQGRVWFLCRNSLALLTEGQLATYPFPGDHGLLWYRFLHRMCSLADGRIVVCDGGSSLILFDPEKKKFETIDHPEQRCMRTVWVSKNGEVLVESFRTWASEDRRKFRIDVFDGREFKTFLDRGNEWSIGIHPTLLEAENGDFWVAGQDGIARYRDGEYRVFGPEDGYDGYGALSMLEIGEGKIWFGSYHAIYEFNGKKWKIVQDGLNEAGCMMKSRDGSTWVAAGCGLRRYYEGSWVENTFEDGLPGVDVLQVTEDSMGRIWAISAGTGEISLYDPNADQDSPETFIDLQNIKEVAPGGKAQFAYTGMDKWKYTEPHRLLYSHRIDDSDWSPFTSDAVAAFAGLSPGWHVFQVRAMDRNWNIDPTPATFEFTVLLPWYRERAFMAIMTLGTLLVITLAVLLSRRHFQLRHSNFQLQQANEELRELDRMKSAFVSQASHDLRTPLTAIKGSLDNLVLGVGGGLNERQQEVMGRALGSADRLTDLINDVLDINRIEAGRVILQKTEVALNAIVQNAVYENQPAAEQKRITIHTVGLQDRYTVTVDPGKMERVVGELIGNAIKYTPEGGSVEVSLWRQDDRVVLSVRDSGIGMTPEECEKIFERFYRTPASQKIGKGSGLGLSIANELVEMHDGTLTVESQAGKGTTVTMTLPTVQERGG